MRWICVLLLPGCFTTPERPGAPNCSDFGPWTQPAEPPNINSSTEEYGPELTPDHLRITFTSKRGSQPDAYEAVRTSRGDVFGPPQPLGLTQFLTNPVLSADGLRIWYSGIGPASWDILTATRASLDAPFGEGEPYEPFASTALDEQELTFSGDQLDAVLHIGPSFPETEIYISHRDSVSDPFPPPVPVLDLDNPDIDCCATLSYDGLYILWESNRGGLHGIFEASRASRNDPFGGIRPFAPVNDGRLNGDPSLTPDGTSMIYAVAQSGSPPYHVFEIHRECVD